MDKINNKTNTEFEFSNFNIDDFKPKPISKSNKNVNTEMPDKKPSSKSNNESITSKVPNTKTINPSLVTRLNKIQPARGLCKLASENWNIDITEKNPLWIPIFQHFTEFSRITFNLNDPNLYLGGGASARVFLGNIDNKSFAIKFILVENNPKLLDLAKKESTFNLNVKDKYFVSCSGCFEYPNYIAIVNQLCINKDLGSLLNYLKDNYANIFKLKMKQILKEDYPTTQIRSYWLSKPSENFGRFLVWQILGGLQVLRSLLFLHKDLKIENLFLTKTFQLKIGDFGFTERLREGKLVNLGEDGTPNYMSPLYFQKYNNVSYNNAFKIDYYALGVIIYYMFTLKYPVEVKKIRLKHKVPKIPETQFGESASPNQNQLYDDLVNEINISISNIDSLNLSKSLGDLLKSNIILLII